MHIAVVSSAPPTMPAAAATADAAAGGSGSIADFAALLLGQLSNGTLPIEPALTETSTDAETTDATAADPALLLAAMGLTLDPAARSNAGELAKGREGGLAGIQSALRNTEQADAGQALADRLKPALAAGDEAAPGAPLQALSATTGTSGALAAQAANFAGFEQKLAESIDGTGESMPHPLAAPAGQTMPRPTGDVQQHVATPVRDPAWSAEFGQKIVWMATQDKQSAQLTLNPPQMGPIEISLSVRNDQATAVFVSGNAEVREAIEAAMPRLREMLAGVGVELGQTNVSAESFRQAQENAGGRQGTGGRGSGDGDTADGLALQQPGGSASSGAIRSGNGLVDTFA